MVDAVRVAAESRAEDCRTTARANARASFAYFLKAVLKVPADPKMCALLQELGQLPRGGRLTLVMPPKAFTITHAQGFLLWLRAQQTVFSHDATRLTFAGQGEGMKTETFSWLFPEAGPVVRHAPSVSVTTSPNEPIAATIFSLHVERM